MVALRKPVRIVRRAPERGAAVFVVVMAITLLTAVGIFAAHSATLVDQAAGYARLARQTQHLAEYAALTSAAELGSGSASPYIEQMAARTQKCNYAETGSPCYKLFFSQLNGRTKQLSNEALLVDETGATEGAIGHLATGAPGVTGDFVVELTDPGPIGAPLAGSDLGNPQGGLRYVKVTATSTAQLRPAGLTCENGVATLTSQQSLRSHMVVGPVQQ
jgi:hypothetical protein